MFSANDQSVPLLAFSHDGSLLAEGRRSWVALWDMRDPSSPQRLGAWHSNVGDPTAVAVLDDGRVLVASATTRLAVWNALGDGSSATLVAGRTDTGVQHLSVAADGSTVLVDYPSFDSVALVDIGDRYDDRHLQRDRPERPAIDAAAGELDLEPVLRRRHGGQLRPRRPRLRVRHRRRAPDHRADRGPHLAGLRLLLQRRGAAVHRQRRRLAAAVEPARIGDRGLGRPLRRPVPRVRRPDRRRQLGARLRGRRR